jgi:hypothetical protein
MTAPSVAPLTEAVTVHIPSAPAYALSPNSRVHWRVKHRQSVAVKEATQMACIGVPALHGPVVLTWTIFLGKSGRRCDIDNLIPCLKPCQDMLALCGVIDGDTPDVVRQIVIADQVLWATHRGLPYISVTITPAERIGNL